MDFIKRQKDRLCFAMSSTWTTAHVYVVRWMNRVLGRHWSFVVVGASGVGKTGLVEVLTDADPFMTVSLVSIFSKGNSPRRSLVTIGCLVLCDATTPIPQCTRPKLFGN